MHKRQGPIGFTSAFRIGVAYLGCCVGAGYLSGQELFQFFGANGNMALPGLLLSVVLMAVCGAVVMSLACDTGEGQMDRIVVFFDCKPLRFLVACFEVLFLLMVFTLCTAAFGSLLFQILGLTPIIGTAIFAALAAALALFGVKGLMRFFAAVIPALVLLTLSISTVALGTADSLTFTKVDAGSFLSGIWYFDAITYTVFGLFCALPVLAPLGASLHNRKTAIKGSIVGAAMFGVMAALILLAMATVPGVTDGELPMLDLAFGKSRFLGIVYAVLMIVGIYSAGLSSLSAINEYFTHRFASRRVLVVGITIALAVVALLLGSLGFKDLIGVLYPIFGYIGFAPVVLLVLHAIKFYRNKKKDKL